MARTRVRSRVWPLEVAQSGINLFHALVAVRRSRGAWREVIVGIGGSPIAGGGISLTHLGHGVRARLLADGRLVDYSPILRRSFRLDYAKLPGCETTADIQALRTLLEGEHGVIATLVANLA